MANLLSDAVDVFHLALVVVMIGALRFSLQPLKYPKLWKFTVGIWLVVPLTQAAFGGRCPLTVLSKWLVGKETDYTPFIQEITGYDVPWWGSLSIGIVIACMSVGPLVQHRQRWVRYDKWLRAQEAKSLAQETASKSGHFRKKKRRGNVAR